MQTTEIIMKFFFTAQVNIVKFIPRASYSRNNIEDIYWSVKLKILYQENLYFILLDVDSPMYHFLLSPYDIFLATKHWGYLFP